MGDGRNARALGRRTILLRLPVDCHARMPRAWPQHRAAPAPVPPPSRTPERHTHESADGLAHCWQLWQQRCQQRKSLSARGELSSLMGNTAYLRHALVVLGADLEVKHGLQARAKHRCVRMHERHMKEPWTTPGATPAPATLRLHGLRCHLGAHGRTCDSLDRSRSQRVEARPATKTHKKRTTECG